jgi:hypothetical protein
VLDIFQRHDKFTDKFDMRSSFAGVVFYVNSFILLSFVAVFDILHSALGGMIRQ